MSLGNYDIALKYLVGLEALFDTIGIRKGNYLTNLTDDFMKSIYDILEEKYFSKITTYIKIIYILTGDF